MSIDPKKLQELAAAPYGEAKAYIREHHDQWHGVEGNEYEVLVHRKEVRWNYYSTVIKVVAKDQDEAGAVADDMASEMDPEAWDLDTSEIDTDDVTVAEIEESS